MKRLSYTKKRSFALLLKLNYKHLKKYLFLTNNNIIITNVCTIKIEIFIYIFKILSNIVQQR